MSYDPVREARGHIWTHPGRKSQGRCALLIETHAYIRPLTAKERVAPRAQVEFALLLLIRLIGLLRPCPLQVLKKLVSAYCAIFSGSSISSGIFSLYL